MEGGYPRGARRTAKPHSLRYQRCRRGHSGVSFFQHLKIQRSVGRARDGATFPVSLKLKSQPGSKEAADGEATPSGGYSASVWVFSTISGLITLLPDGTIYGINHSFALMLFGYGRAELLGKVGRGAGRDPHRPVRRACCCGGRFPWGLGPRKRDLCLGPMPRLCPFVWTSGRALACCVPPRRGKGLCLKACPTRGLV